MGVLAAQEALRAQCAMLMILWTALSVYTFLSYAKNLFIRKNVTMIEYPTRVGRWLSGLQYLVLGPTILVEAHTDTTPYAIRTPETYYVHFSNKCHIKELIEASEAQMSLHALSKDMFQPRYTMNGLEVEDDMVANGSVHSRALRFHLRSHLPDLALPMQESIAASFEKEILRATKDLKGRSIVRTFDAAKRIVVHATSLVFFGEGLTRDPVFLEAALAYPEDLMKTAEVLRLIPSLVAPVVAPLLMRSHRASTVLVQRLIPVVDNLLYRPSTDLAEKGPENCVHFFVQASKRKRTRWTAVKVIQALLGVWFAAIHQPAMSLAYALDDLCKHDELREALRLEVMDAKQKASSIEECPLLDAFLKESARMNPSDSISVRRKVLQRFTFSDGTRLEPNDVACVPLKTILRDPRYYKDPDKFDPYRFIGGNVPNGEQPTVNEPLKFTDTSIHFPLWGLGKRSCPGRFYAAVLLKLALAQVLLNYSIEIHEGPQQSRRRFFWRSAIVPSSAATVAIGPL